MSGYTEIEHKTDLKVILKDIIQDRIDDWDDDKKGQTKELVETADETVINAASNWIRKFGINTKFWPKTTHDQEDRLHVSSQEIIKQRLGLNYVKHFLEELPSAILAYNLEAWKDITEACKEASNDVTEAEKKVRDFAQEINKKIGRIDKLEDNIKSVVDESPGDASIKENDAPKDNPAKTDKAKPLAISAEADGTHDAGSSVK